MMETLAEYAAWLANRFEDDDAFTELQSFADLRRVLDEQCYRIPDRKTDEEERCEEDSDDDDDDSPGWEPIQPFSSSREETEQDEADDEAVGSTEDDQGQPLVGLKDPEEIDSGSLQNPHDDEATYRSKYGEEH